MKDHQSQYRYDPLQQRWVIIADERGKRPDDFNPPKDPQKKGFCPFCPGHESKTPPQILQVSTRGDEDAWQIRVVPNKFPALRVEGQPVREADGIYDGMSGVGAHEVIVETPNHDSLMANRNVEEIFQLFSVYRERLRDLSQDERLRYILVFKNHGSFAGASLSHPHSQIMATTVVPRIVESELHACSQHFGLKERCLVCDIVKQEVTDRDRIISIDDRYIAFCPYAARFPFEVFIAPRRHQHDYASASDDSLRGLAAIVKDSLRRLNGALDNPPYNYVLHTIPNVHVRPSKAHVWDNLELEFHWHIELLPRLTRVAGFEWGTGIYINPTRPEDAAEYLRQA